MPAHFESMGMVVQDMKATLDFYRQLGLDIPAGAESEGHVEAQLPNGMRLMWDTEAVVRSFNPDWKAPTGGSRIGLAFLCDSPAEVEATYKHMTEMGFHGHLPPFDAFWGQRYATLHDPDGNHVDLFAPL
jgi:catechol 2,3-dioxygenase-like lactoylglutathione lyase family enzyme